MSYWKGLGVAVAIDLIWIMGCPLLATEPPLEMQREPAQQVADLTAIGQVADSLRESLQDQPNDVDAMQKLADVYASHGLHEAGRGPLPRPRQLDPTGG